jgi:hypothetical protein
MRDRRHLPRISCSTSARSSPSEPEVVAQDERVIQHSGERYAKRLREAAEGWDQLIAGPEPLLAVMELGAATTPGQS